MIRKSLKQLSDTYLPLHQMRTELGLLKRPVLPATNTFLECVYASFNTGKVSKVSNKKFPYFRAI